MLTRFLESKEWILAALAVVLTASLATAGSIIQVKSDYPVDTTLSDLIVYGSGGLKKTFLAPSNAADDIVLHPGDTRIFDAGFEVTSYFVSRESPSGEVEAICFNVMQLGARKISMFTVPGGPTLFTSLDYSLINFPPPAEGTSFSFVNGTTGALPGYFVGTSADFVSGSVSSPYTGSATLVTGFTVETTPEPSTWFLLLSGFTGLVVYLSRSRKARAGTV